MKRYLAEKAELVIQAYEKHLDLKVAFIRQGVNDEEQDILMSDEVFVHRIAIIDASLYEDLVQELRDLAFTAKNEGVKLSAIKDLGKMLSLDRFSTDKKDATSDIPKTVVLVGKYPDDIKE